MHEYISREINKDKQPSTTTTTNPPTTIKSIKQDLFIVPDHLKVQESVKREIVAISLNCIPEIDLGFE